MSMKARVPLASVRPSGQNPRRDFGDISALARTIEATGGQPVNPIVVVEDGAADDGTPSYRIVDGERRYRALVELGADEADVLVFLDWAAAEEAVAMLATDDKRSLTPEERARGFQSMLALGVSDEVAGAAARVDPAVVRRVRRVVPEAPEQATLDAMIAASEFDDPSDREEVLSSDHPAYAAERVRRRLRDASVVAETCERVDELAGEGRLRAEWRDPGSMPTLYSSTDSETYLTCLRRPGDAERLADGHGDDLVALYRKDSYVAVWRVLTDDERAERGRAADELSARRDACGRSKDLVRSLVRSVARFAASGADPVTRPVPLLREWAQMMRDEDLVDAAALGLDGDDADLASDAAASTPSAWEVLAAISSLFVGRPGDVQGIALMDGWDDECAQGLSDLVAAATGDGWSDDSCAEALAHLAEWVASRDSEEG